jgi:hypothetical protein
LWRDLRAALCADLWKPLGVWSVLGFSLKPQAAGGWSLEGAFRTDFDLQRFAAGNSAPTPLFTLRGPWAVGPAGIDFLSTGPTNAGFALHAEFKLDRAAVDCWPPFLKYDYHKPARTPSTLKTDGLNVEFGRGRALAGLVRLDGGPLNFEARDVDVTWTPGGTEPDVTAGDRTPTGKKRDFSLRLVRCGAFSAAGEPFPFTLTAFSWTAAVRKADDAPPPDHEDDRLAFRVRAPKVDLGYLAQTVGLPPTLRLQGLLTEADASFDLPWRTLRNPNLLKPNDLWQINGRLRDAVFTAFENENECLTVQALDGLFTLTPTTWTLRDVEAALRVAEPADKSGAKRAAILRLRVPTLTLAAASSKAANVTEKNDDGIGLFAAMATETAKLRFEAARPVLFENACDLEATLHAAETLLRVTRAAFAGTPPNGASEAWWDKLELSGGMRTPELRFGTWSLPHFEAPAATFQQRVLDIPRFTARPWGGELAASLRFATEPATDEGGSPRTSAWWTPLRIHPELSNFETRFQLSGAVLDDWFPEFEPWRLHGRLSAEGEYRGRGLRPADRAAWNGSARFTLRGLSLEQLPEKPDAPPHPLIRYLRAWGVETAVMEFDEPITAVLSAENGAYALAATRLLGKGPQLGLALNVQGRLDADGRWGETSAVWVERLSATALRNRQLERHAPNERTELLRLLAEGRFPLRLSGAKSSPEWAWPAAEMHRGALRALFGMESVETGDDLRRALAFLRRWWSGTPEETRKTVVWAEQCGVIFPGTEAARIAGKTSLDVIFSDAAALPDLQPLLRPFLQARKENRILTAAEAFHLLLSSVGEAPPGELQSPASRGSGDKAGDTGATATEEIARELLERRRNKDTKTVESEK